MRVAGWADGPVLLDPTQGGDRHRVVLGPGRRRLVSARLGGIRPSAESLSARCVGRCAGQASRPRCGAAGAGGGRAAPAPLGCPASAGGGCGSCCRRSSHLKPLRAGPGAVVYRRGVRSEGRASFGAQCFDMGWVCCSSALQLVLAALRRDVDLNIPC